MTLRTARPGNPFVEGVGVDKKGKGRKAPRPSSASKIQMPMGFSLKTGYFYVPATEWGMAIWNEPFSCMRGAAYLGAGLFIKPCCTRTSSARCVRLDPVSGKIVWEVKNNALAVGWRDDHRWRPGVLRHASRAT